MIPAALAGIKSNQREDGVKVHLLPEVRGGHKDKIKASLYSMIHVLCHLSSTSGMK